MTYSNTPGSTPQNSETLNSVYNAAIQPKASTVAGQVPLAVELIENELALNSTDGLLFTKNAAGEIVTIAGGGGGGAVDSVNGQVGIVELGIGDLTDVTYSTTFATIYKYATYYDANLGAPTPGNALIQAPDPGGAGGAYGNILANFVDLGLLDSQALYNDTAGNRIWISWDDGAAWTQYQCTLTNSTTFGTLELWQDPGEDPTSGTYTALVIPPDFPTGVWWSFQDPTVVLHGTLAVEGLDGIHYASTDNPPGATSSVTLAEYGLGVLQSLSTGGSAFWASADAAKGASILTAGRNGQAWIESNGDHTAVPTYGFAAIYDDSQVPLAGVALIEKPVPYSNTLQSAQSPELGQIVVNFTDDSGTNVSSFFDDADHHVWISWDDGANWTVYTARLHNGTAYGFFQNWKNPVTYEPTPLVVPDPDPATFTFALTNPTEIGNTPMIALSSGRQADSDTAKHGHYIGARLPINIQNDTTYTLPPTDGTAGQALTTDGAGHLSWQQSGAVESVNGESGVVELGVFDLDDVKDFPGAESQRWTYDDIVRTSGYPSDSDVNEAGEAAIQSSGQWPLFVNAIDSNGNDAMTEMPDPGYNYIDSWYSFDGGVTWSGPHDYTQINRYDYDVQYIQINCWSSNPPVFPPDATSVAIAFGNQPYNIPAGAQDGQILNYSSAETAWVAGPPAFGVFALNDCENTQTTAEFGYYGPILSSSDTPNWNMIYSSGSGLIESQSWLIWANPTAYSPGGIPYQTLESVLGSGGSPFDLVPIWISWDGATGASAGTWIEASIYYDIYTVYPGDLPDPNGDGAPEQFQYYLFYSINPFPPAPTPSNMADVFFYIAFSEPGKIVVNNGQILKYNSSIQKFTPQTAIERVQSVNGQGMFEINGEWHGSPEVVLNLGDINNVDTSSTVPAHGDVLTWDNINTQWIPQAPAGGGGGGGGAIEWQITAVGTTAWAFYGPGFTNPTNNPTLYVVPGETYTFTKTADTPSTTFQLDTIDPTTVAYGSLPAAKASATPYTDGVTGTQPFASGQIVWTVPMDAPSVLYYTCPEQPAMSGTIYVLDNPAGLVTTVNGMAGEVSLGVGQLADVGLPGGALPPGPVFRYTQVTGGYWEPEKTDDTPGDIYYESLTFLEMNVLDADNLDPVFEVNQLGYMNTNQTVYISVDLGVTWETHVCFVDQAYGSATLCLQAPDPGPFPGGTLDPQTNLVTPTCSEIRWSFSDPTAPPPVTEDGMILEYNSTTSLWVPSIPVDMTRLTSPDGSIWEVTIDNAGNLITTKLP